MQRSKFILLGCAILFAANAGFARGGDATYPATMAQIHSKLSHLGVENAKHGNVQAEFQNGVVVLTGTVESVGIKNDVEKQIAKAAGVNSVVARSGGRWRGPSTAIRSLRIMATKRCLQFTSL